MKLLLLLFIFSQLVIFPNLSFRWCKELSVQILIIVSICSLIWQRNKCIALFVLWNLFLFFYFKSYVINDYGRNSQYNINFLAFFNIINIVLYGLFYYVLHQIKLNKDLIYKTFCFIAIFQSVYIILQFLQFDQFFYNISLLMGIMVDGKLTHFTTNWPVGTWGNEALVSWCIVICAPFFLAFNKLRFKIGYGLCFIAVLMTKCSAGIAGFVLGFLFWLFFKGKRLIAISLLVLILISGAIGFTSGKLSYYFNPTHRFGVWKKTISIWNGDRKMGGGKELTGFGLGSFRVLFWQKAPQYREQGHWTTPHNDYVQVLFEQGIIGLGIILSLMWITFWKFWKKRKGLIPITSLFILSMVAFWGFPMRTAMGILPIVALVLFEVEYET